MEVCSGLEATLQRWFGFSTFRPNQQAACEAVVQGRDVLLVMPTGSGKSLCYQLPGLVRGGTTLVISPLIALMEDQAAKLKDRGFAVERIHSGRDRAASRQACSDYLQGRLQFLFVAPERLRVPGFVPMLTRRRPSLIAIDEAHCISQWGHDFRPDYRMLGQHLPLLRPAPVIAMTATATRIVQRDIVEQLGLIDPVASIGGFRRDNIAIEIVDVLPSDRTKMVKEILRRTGALPAIIYAPTRTETEQLASELSTEFRASAYHAGLTSECRNAVQDQFLSNELDVIVATIAFGMGIDKPDVRTILHTGLPGSVEGYYQEIGRAGRDGLPSRAILMHSYSDRRTHDYFFERDYPPVELLDLIHGEISGDPVSRERLAQKVRMPLEQFEKAFEKLWVHGGAIVDDADDVVRGSDDWRRSYLAQRKHRSEQIELILRYVSSHRCRMAAVVHYFGDVAGSKMRCGNCDHCAPELCVAQRFRPMHAWESDAVWKVVRQLRSTGQSTSGQLFKELYPSREVTRHAFESVLGAMARAELLSIRSALLEREGKQIPYRKVSLTVFGQTVEESTPLRILMKVEGRSSASSTRKRNRRNPAMAASRPASSQARSVAPELMKRLRDWRLAEAKQRGLPAFRICTDEVLHAIAREEPADDSDLLSIRGVGRQFVQRYGAAIYRFFESPRDSKM